ncbi:MAG: hypothetical protein C4325_00450 [Blastocatellia bacterium]
MGDKRIPFFHLATLAMRRFLNNFPLPDEKEEKITDASLISRRAKCCRLWTKNFSNPLRALVLYE